ncbi:f46cd932-4b93-4b0d-8228-314bcff1d398 [Thermothielavioides terrestris]|nr:f46cd932-4b93-4b0d-8228-314bcff1d398 [Thermothielavioides terrestris]
MLYVSDKTTIPIPRVYALFQKEDEHGRMCTYIVMEHVDGQTLDMVWRSLDLEAKEAAASQLRDFMDQLRGLPAPDFFGSLDNRPLLDYLFFTEEARPEINGPFKTEAEIAEALVLKLQRDEADYPAERAAYYRRVLPSVLQGDGRPRFTHADLQTTNIMLRPDGTVVLLDWEMAGWYPRYWEYATAIFGCGGWSQWTDDFHAWVPKFLDEYPNEYLWLGNIRSFLWF